MKKEEKNKETIQLSFEQLYHALRGLDKFSLNAMLYLLLLEKKISVKDVLARLEQAHDEIADREKGIRIAACNCLNSIISHRNMSTKNKSMRLFLKRAVYLANNHGNIGKVSEKVEEKLGYDDKMEAEIKESLEDIYDIKL